MAQNFIDYSEFSKIVYVREKPYVHRCIYFSDEVYYCLSSNISSWQIISKSAYIEIKPNVSKKTN